MTQEKFIGDLNALAFSGSSRSPTPNSNHRWAVQSSNLPTALFGWATILLQLKERSQFDVKDKEAEATLYWSWYHAEKTSILLLDRPFPTEISVWQSSPEEPRCWLLGWSAPDRSVVLFDAAATFRMLPMILIEASQRGDFKCKKLVVCLTKADAYFAEHADRALAQLKRSSPSLRALTLLTQPGYRALRQTLPNRLQAYAGWTSVYGYLTNGRSTTTRRPMHCASIRRMIRRRRPSRCGSRFVSSSRSFTSPPG